MSLRDRLLADLFADAMAQAPSSRIAWLAAHCADAALRREVESMLAAVTEVTEGPAPPRRTTR